MLRNKVKNNLLPRRNNTLSFRGVRFSPQDVPNLSLWYDADDISTVTTTDTRVDQWRSKADVNNADQTGDNRPVFVQNVINGRGAINFSPIIRFLQLTSTLTLADEFHIFVVTRTPDKSTTRMIFGDSASNKKIGIVPTGEKLAVRIISSLDNAVDFPLADDTFGVLEFNRDSANKVDFNFNFQTTPTRLFSDAAQSGNYTINRFARDDVTSYYPGDIAEIIIYSRKLTTEERTNLRESIVQKYWGAVERNADGSPKLDVNNDFIKI